jgi:phosphoserine aminotransferase
VAQRVYNFSPGPAVLPLPVLEAAQKELLALEGVGMSVLEISHRSKAFAAILAEAQSLLRSLLNIPDNYKILFLQGGSSLQFTMLAKNLLSEADRGADYVVTGSWGSKALAAVNVAWTGKPTNFDRLPTQQELKLDDDASYVHITSNETIQGVQWKTLPNFGSVPVICDCSSDFLSRPIDVAKYGMIYACAQKNAGVSGVTVVIIRDDLITSVPKDLPPMLDYRVQAENDSLYNTPPTFGIYIVMLICRWLKDAVGGLDKMDELNAKKAKLLYDAIDSSEDYYKPHAAKECRSLMNVTWRLPTEELETKFVTEAKARDLYDLKGHRSVGGIRASIYNAMPIEGVQALAQYMNDFRQQNPA